MACQQRHSDAKWQLFKQARIQHGTEQLPKNRILGSDIAGRVEAVGRTVKQFLPGDEVFGGHGLGSVEYVCIL